MSERLKIHETTAADGTLVSVFLVRCDAGMLAVVDGTEGDLPLPKGAVAAVMARFGAPLDPEEESRLIAVASLDLGEQRTLRHVRHLAHWDVIARDYLVYDDGQTESVCALATTVAGALQHLGGSARGRTL